MNIKDYCKIHRTPMVYIAVTLAVAFGVLLAARSIPGFGQFYAVHIFPLFPNTLGRVFSVVPFSVFEFCLYIFAVLSAGLFIYLIAAVWRKVFRSPKKPAGAAPALKFVCLCSTLFLLFSLACGVNYSREGFAADADITVSPSSPQALLSLSELLIDELETLVLQIDTDSNGDFSLAGHNTETTCKEAMINLGETYPTLSGYYPDPKPVLMSRKMSYLNISGIYSPFTVEANYNMDVPHSIIPFTVCHELSHLKGYIMEEDAGFISYLACSNSDSAELRYSGALMGLSYTLSPLYNNCTLEEYSRILQSLPPQVLHDLQAKQAYWQPFQGDISKLSSMANDTYLKVNAQADGVKSYGRMVDLMISYYRLDSSII